VATAREAVKNKDFLAEKQKSIEEAREWYEKAAAQGNAIAQFNLGVLYHYGKGVPQDDTMAREWYGKAAAQGFALAQNNLGVLYAQGLGVPKNFVEAYAWTNIAATQGVAGAAKLRDSARKELDPAALMKAQALSEKYYAQYVKPFQ
jgi:TPR repeat protein